MAALGRPKAQLPKWWALPPAVIVVTFNVVLTLTDPMMSWSTLLPMLIAVGLISIGVTFGVVWLIARYQTRNHSDAP
jgi:hypothetical protein